ncbi:MAG: sugar ABC transporter ATP-binding protein [Gemmatimonadales bacterium]|nr:MAG: sugar ABC transporter ATP-binding protein [Gemmatimonadales bacterium]
MTAEQPQGSEAPDDAAISGEQGGTARGPEGAAGAGAHLVLEARQLSRRFGPVVALDGVDLEVYEGAVTCVLGDNGAGKSTLIRILSGVHRPSSGTLLLDGRSVEIPSPRAARRLGIATVHQNLGIVPLMSIWRNFVLGAEPARGWGPLRRLDRTRARDEATTELARMGITVRDPDEPVGVLSGGERQSLAIARALHQGARVLILDEPTAALGVRQSALVLDRVIRARDRGTAVILITHNPEHALQVGDRFVVLARGRVTARRERGNTDREELSELMRGSPQ